MSYRSVVLADQLGQG